MNIPRFPIISRNRTLKHIRVPFMFFLETLPLALQVGQYLDFEQHRLVLTFFERAINGTIQHLHFCAWISLPNLM